MEWNLFNVTWIAFWIIVVSFLSQSLVLNKAKEEKTIDFKQKLFIAFVCVLLFIWFFLGYIPIFSVD